MISTATLPVSVVKWEGAVRIIRSIYPLIDLFEDIADPADWPLLISAEQKTNPRLSDERAGFLSEHWAKQNTEGQWEILGDPAHKLTSPLLYHVEEPVYFRL